MTETEYKMTLTVAILSKMQTNLEDLVDDGQFRFEHKQNANRVISSIDKFIEAILKGLDVEALKELDNINESVDQFFKYEPGEENEPAN